MSVAAAAARAEVRLSDGRTGWLMWWPGPNTSRSKGAKARVVLESGAFVSVPTSEVEVL